MLTSSYSEIAGIPLAAFGAVAYFLAFSLALLTAFGRDLWRLFGLLTIVMAAFSVYLIYVQYALIHAWCQFCLISAATTFTLFLIYLVSLFIKPKAAAWNPTRAPSNSICAGGWRGKIW